MSKPNFAKILKYRYFKLFGLLLTFVYNIVKGKNWAEILFTEAIVLLFACDTLKIPKFWNNEEKDLIPGEEGAKLVEEGAQLGEDGAKLVEEGAKLGEEGAKLREEDAKLREDKYVSYEQAIEIYHIIRSSPIDDNNRPGFRLIQKELNTKLNK